MRLLFLILIFDAPLFLIDSLTLNRFMSCMDMDEDIRYEEGILTFIIRFFKFLESFEENSLSKSTINIYIYVQWRTWLIEKYILPFVHPFIVRTIIRSVLSGLLIVPLCYTHFKPFHPFSR